MRIIFFFCKTYKIDLLFSTARPRTAQIGSVEARVKCNDAKPSTKHVNWRKATEPRHNELHGSAKLSRSTKLISNRKHPLNNKI